jgi:DNA-binding SARP family transcriptional activator
VRNGKKMTAWVLYLENQKAKMIGFSTDSDSVFEEVNIENNNTNAFYDELADSMESSSEVLLLGPDEEKGNFRRWLLTHRRNLGRKLVAVLPAKSITADIAKTYKRKYLR